MLKPGTARTILHVLLNLGLLGIGAMLATLLWITLTGGFGKGVMSWTVPVGIGLQAGGQNFHITSLSLPVKHPSAWVWVLWLCFTLLLTGVVILAYLRFKTFVNRVLDDPFDRRNITDIRLAAQLGLIWQGVSLSMSLFSWWIIGQTRPAEALTKALAGSPDVTVIGATYDYTLSSLKLFGLNLTPLVIAALLAILATVFQRAHDLREAERTLRAEQELTV